MQGPLVELPLPAIAADEVLTRAVALAYLVFEKPNLPRQKKFLENFGLLPLAGTDETLYLRSHEQATYCYRCQRGRRSRLLGLGIEVESSAELAKLAAHFGTCVETVAWPCPGQRVSVTDPNGFAVEFVVWQPPARAPTPPAPPTPRAPGHALRAPLRPSRVRKLGHVVLDVFEFQRSLDWYRRTLGLRISDLLCLDDGRPVVAFLRFDRGAEAVEHHSLVLGLNIQAGHNHSAYEVSGLDDLAMGQQLLAKEGWRHWWGLGRHLLGSQIFDYWRDPDGEVMEHYIDSDRYDAGHATGVHPLSSEGLYQWAPPVPAGFGLPRMTLAKFRQLIAALARSPDLSIRRLLAMKRRMSQPARPWL